MAQLNVLEFIASKIRGAGRSKVTLEELSEELAADLYIRELAFWSCVNLIARAIGKCEFKTFLRGREVQEREYYLWNVSPNANQNSSGFIAEWLARLYHDGECLILADNNQLILADSYDRDRNIGGDVFTGITRWEHTFEGAYRQQEVLFYELGSIDGTNMRALLNRLYAGYAKLLAAGMQGYRAGRGQKAVLNYDALPVAANEVEEFQHLINHRLKDFMSGDIGVLPLGRGHTLTEYGNQKTVRSETSRDIRAMVDDISDFTARAFAVPVSLLNGSVQNTDSAIEQFLTFCIDPLADMLQEEINRKRYSYRHFRDGTRLRIDTHSIRHVDILKMAPNIDKLISSGSKSVNEIRAIIGDSALDEPWANEHFMTKNYQLARKMLTEQEAG